MDRRMDGVEIGGEMEERTVSGQGICLVKAHYSKTEHTWLAG